MTVNYKKYKGGKTWSNLTCKTRGLIQGIKDGISTLLTWIKGKEHVKC